jgi:hypothetical protein
MEYTTRVISAIDVLKYWNDIGDLLKETKDCVIEFFACAGKPLEVKVLIYSIMDKNGMNAQAEMDPFSFEKIWKNAKKWTDKINTNEKLKIGILALEQKSTFEYISCVLFVKENNG